MKDAVHRRAPLPTTRLIGDFFIARSVILSTERVLPTFRDARGDHEGVVFWGGRETDAGTFIVTAVVPGAEHSSGRVYVPHQGVLEVVHLLRQCQLGLIAQVHSHPGADARHSDGDDRMVVAPFEGMLSIVVPHYAKFGMTPLSGCGIHQFQDERWNLCLPGFDTMRVISDLTDLR